VSANIYSLAENVERICTSTYVPDSTDIIHARIRTTGVHKHIIVLPDSSTCHVIDVGGERAERKKWIHVVNNSPTVLFFAPMGDYDQMRYEDENGASNFYCTFRILVI
jgi:guanine nucleotide-binding protein G(i) subunit alpha